MTLTGFTYPLQINAEGGISLSSDADYIEQQIRSYVETELGERLGLPKYGLPDYLFQTYQAVGFIARDLETKLPTFIPQATLSCRAEINDSGEASVEIDWTYLEEEQSILIFNFERG
jgi:phage baseplate assembly protein W